MKNFTEIEHVVALRKFSPRTDSRRVCVNTDEFELSHHQSSTKGIENRIETHHMKYWLR